MTSLHDVLCAEINAHDRGRCLSDCHVCRKRSAGMQKALLLFLRGEQRPIHRDSVVAFMVRAGRTDNGTPNARAPAWCKQLGELVQVGKVTAAGERVQIVRDIPASDNQETLF